MKTKVFPRRLSVVYNLERDPVELDDQTEEPWYKLESGLPEPSPLHSDTRIVSHTFHGWALMLVWAAMLIVMGFTVKTMGEQVFDTYAARIHS